MIEVGRLYELDSNPLEEVINKEIGGTYYTVEGHGIKYLGDDEYEFQQRTPLNKGYLITELEGKLLDMFWKLRRNDIFYKEG